ncbi:DUF4430 domain-containing protein [Capillimicrobium parvum]|uniref:DUF4430 domain-containing protein n=1 Tax=Capillimicrobium parvum TaxID=2884022 RepID=A0A9E6XWY7_9ACTN|nr:DUF4430 domain-containing protein [Capillimicrobium parvum]UGS35680.1 hypothetical protein DSM104329_02075 [Capillimicrobium parvum]
MRPLRLAALAAVAAGSLALGACGGRSPSGSSDVSVLVTRDSGAQRVGDAGPQPAAGGQTLLSLLRAGFDVRESGGRVQAIDGTPGPWRVFVNGVHETGDPAKAGVHAGDRIWWDAHRVDVPAVIGSYPEPFAHGRDGRRWPVRVECVRHGDKRSCDAIAKRLGESGILASQSLIGTEGGDENLRVLVGPWSAMRGDRAARLVDLGPRASGVAARFSDDGRSLALLDAGGHVVRTLGPGSGLIAATAFDDQPPTWFITGTDAAGVASAVRAFDEGTLADRFALAVGDDRGIPLPLRSPGTD